jgi:hypothetical protein
MHRIRCIVVLAEGGFKINGPSIKDKGPMSNEKDQSKNNETSLSRPTQVGRIETCTELIEQAMRCLENNDKQCVTRLIEELIKANCHDGRLIGKVVADKVRELVHELWLASSGDNEFRCGLLRMLRDLRDLGISRNWVRDALGMNTKTSDKWLVRCGIDWENKITRNEVVKDIENLLREKFGWDEIRMCEEMWRFIGVNVDEFRRHGIEPCAWLSGLELLSDLRRPYWLGLARSDLAIRELDDRIELEINTTSSIGAVFFVKILNIVKTPSLVIEWKKRAPAAKYVSETINLSYYVYLGIGDWPWPELSADKLEKILEKFSDEEFAEFVAGIIDGDGTVIYYYNDESKTEFVFVSITACKACPKRYTLEVLKEIIARRFGIVGAIYHLEKADALVFYYRNAVKLLRRIVKHMHHPLRRLRAELILAYYDGRISREAFEKLYEQTEYVFGGPDIKRNHALEALAQAAPQTHTHGE